MKKFLWLILSSVSISLFAADETPAAGPAVGNVPPQPPSGGVDGDRPQPGGRRENFMHMMQSVREQYPAEFEEIEKLRSSDPRGAMEKMRSLMEKAGFSMPQRGERPGSEERSSGKNSSASEKNESRAVSESDIALCLQRIVNYLRSKSPDEWADVELMLASDPQTGWDAFLAMCRKYGRKVPHEATIKDLKYNTISERDVIRVTMERIDREIKRKFPEDYEKLLAARVKEPALARRMFIELVKKGNISTELVTPTSTLPVDDNAASSSTNSSTGASASSSTSAPSGTGSRRMTSSGRRDGNFSMPGGNRDFSSRRSFSRRQGNSGGMSAAGRGE